MIDYIRWASGFYLCETLPENWESLEDWEQDEFVTENAWQPFEYWSAKDLWTEISSLASSAERLVERAKHDE